MIRTTQFILMKSLLILVLCFGAVQQANASLVVVGDVNADVSANWGFYDSILGSGQSVLFSRQDYNQTGLLNHYNALTGVTASQSFTATLDATLLSNVDLLVVTASFQSIFQSPVYSDSEYDAISSYLQGGGSVLMIVETAIGATAPLDSYNSFLAEIGSSIQMTGRGGSGSSANAQTINGIFGDFTVGTSSYFSGGTAAYEATFGTVVATESFGRSRSPRPPPCFPLF